MTNRRGFLLTSIGSALTFSLRAYGKPLDKAAIHQLLEGKIKAGAEASSSYTRVLRKST